MFFIFKRWSLAHGPVVPWSHTDIEWHEMTRISKDSEQHDSLTFEENCPQIVLVLKLFRKNMYGRTQPLAHPSRGLISEFINSLARDKNCLITINAAVKKLERFAWIYFLDLMGSECKLESLNYDIVALLGFELIQHEANATRIEAFVGRIVHKVVRDIICLKKDEELATMWHELKTSSQSKVDAEDVSIRPKN